MNYSSLLIKTYQVLFQSHLPIGLKNFNPINSVPFSIQLLFFSYKLSVEFIASHILGRFKDAASILVTCNFQHDRHQRREPFRGIEAVGTQSSSTEYSL